MKTDSKPRIVFPFVEAGLGHIMPMTAIADAFEAKYGDRVSVVRTNFFQDTHDPVLSAVEQDFVDEVLRHNRKKWRGKLTHALMNILGTKFSMRYVFKKRHKRALCPALEYIRELNADIIFSTHLSTHYYACEAKRKGYTGAKVIGYCPDPIIGRQWDRRVDLMAVSSALGVKKARQFGRYKRAKVTEVPFLLRREVETYNMGRAYYRRALGLPEDNFTVLLSDGAYGAGKIRDTVYGLIGKAKQPLTIVAVCGKNEALYKEFCALDVPPHITFAPYGFTDKTLMLAAACDLFMGKAGASNLAEPVYFGAPCIVTFTATFVEKWICAHHQTNGVAVKKTNVNKAVDLALKFAGNPELMKDLTDACAAQKRCDGSEVMADRLYCELYNSGQKTQRHRRKASILPTNELYPSVVEDVV